MQSYDFLHMVIDIRCGDRKKYYQVSKVLSYYQVHYLQLPVILSGLLFRVDCFVNCRQSNKSNAKLENIISVTKFFHFAYLH